MEPLTITNVNQSVIQAPPVLPIPALDPNQPVEMKTESEMIRDQHIINARRATDEQANLEAATTGQKVYPRNTIPRPGTGNIVDVLA